MVIYLGGFTISVALFALADKVKKTQRVPFIFIAILIPCFIAGFRASSVGVDTETYLVPMTKAALASDSIGDYMDAYWFCSWRNLYVKDYEIGFSLVVYLIAKIFQSVVAVQFVIQLLVIVPIYFAIKRMKYKTWISISVYYLIFFNTSLNMMRQMIAVAFVLLAMQHFIEGNRKWFIWVICVGCLFHLSGVIGFLIAFVYSYVLRNSNKRYYSGIKSRIGSDNMHMVIVIMASICMLLGIGIIIQILPYIGLGRFVNYLRGASGSIHFLPMQIVTRLPILILFGLNWKNLKVTEPNLRFFFTMLCLDIIVAQLASINIYSGRIATYFTIFGISSYASLCSGRRKKFNGILLFAYLLFYWWYFYVLLGRDTTIPYIFI